MRLNEIALKLESDVMTTFRELPTFLPEDLQKVERRIVVARMIQAIQHLDSEVFSAHDLINTPFLKKLTKVMVVARYLSLLCKMGYVELLFKQHKGPSFYRRSPKILKIQMK